MEGLPISHYRDQISIIIIPDRIISWKNDIEEDYVKKTLLYLLLAVTCVTMFASCDFIMGFFGNGVVTGVVKDAATENPISGVTVSCSGSTATSGTDGKFSIEVPAGKQTLSFSKASYTIYDQTITVVKDTENPLPETVWAYAPLSAGQWRIVLTWGAEPEDLDLHLKLPETTEEVYYSHKIANDGSANLDVDDTESYGPETITITNQHSGDYIVFVDNYSETPAFTASEATVKVFSPAGLAKTFKVSNATGDKAKYYWRVFKLNGSVITTNQTMADTAY